MYSHHIRHIEIYLYFSPYLIHKSSNSWTHPCLAEEKDIHSTNSVVENAKTLVCQWLKQLQICGHIAKQHVSVSESKCLRITLTQQVFQPVAGMRQVQFTGMVSKGTVCGQYWEDEMQPLGVKMHYIQHIQC